MKTCLGTLSKVEIEDILKQFPEGLNFDQIQQFDRQGYLIVENIISEQEITEGINELWDIIESAPLINQIKRPPNLLGQLQPKEIKKFSQNWVPWKSFGMLSEPPVFHTKIHWKIRQNEKLYNIFCQLYQNKKLWCSLDRASLKLPKEGDEEFNHWDFDPWFPQRHHHLQGIVNLCKRSFRCIPESNQEKWQRDFKEKYSYLQSKEPRSCVQLDKNKDYWNLGKILPFDSQQKPDTEYGCIRDIVCPRGSIVIFSSRLMHSVAKNNSQSFQYGLYLSYFPAGNRDFMAVYNSDSYQYRIHNPWVKEGDTEVSDRIRSYQTGTAPYKLPGSSIFQYATIRGQKAAQKKRKPESLTQTNNGYPWASEYLPQNYSPPPLNSLGKKLLGIESYQENEEYEKVLDSKTLKKLKTELQAQKQQKYQSKQEEEEEEKR